MARRGKAIGQRGSWFAKINGEEYPCVHKHWFKQGRYNDPGVKLGDKQCDELVSALRAKKAAILTDDVAIEREGQPLGFDRRGYIALWSIDEVEFDEAGLRFRFTGRLAEL